MKFKYCFALFLILTAMFLLGSVAAGENVNHNATASDDTYLSVDAQYPLSASNDDAQLSAEDNENVQSLGRDGDLNVDMELGEIKKTTYGINQITFDVPLIITANSNTGIAKNVKISLVIPEDFEYVSDEKNIGTYNQESGIWNIGDLNSGFNASLTIFTKITKKGNFVITVNGTTDSTDMNLKNNNLNCNIQVSSKITSNTTRTSSDSSEARHDSHYASEGNNRPDDNQKEVSGNDKSPADNGKSSNSKSIAGKSSDVTGDISSSREGNSKKGSGNGISSNSEDGNIASGNNVAKEINPNVITKVAKSLRDTLDNILNHDPDQNEDSDNHLKAVKAISFYNYTHVPILIFVLFFVALIGIYGYDKIKS